MASLPTGDAWDVTDPKKPFMDFDPDAVLDIPYDWIDWLAAISDIYADHEMKPVPLNGVSLLCSESAEVGGRIIARIKKPVSGDLVPKKKYGMTCHIVTADGQEEDFTLWFKIREK